MKPAEPVQRLVDRIQSAAPEGGVNALRAALAVELVLLNGEIPGSLGGDVAWSDGTDVPGSAYEQLLPAPERRAAGQFQTPLWAADLMGRWLLSSRRRPCLTRPSAVAASSFGPSNTASTSPKSTSDSTSTSFA